MTDQPRYTITKEAGQRWMADHGLDPNDVMAVSVWVRGRDLGQPIGMLVDLLIRDGQGRIVTDAGDVENRRSPARETRVVPVRSFPELTPYVGDRADE